jgi:methionine-S-sulfoxide reductase
MRIPLILSLILLTTFFFSRLMAKEENFNNIQTKNKKYEKAVVAGGCFWGVEELFRHKKGVIDTQVGYAGGAIENPIYELVKTGNTGFAEAVEISFDPQIVSYDEIIDFFFKLHDPTTLNRQGNDIGTQYRSAIFPVNNLQEEKARLAIERANLKWKKKVTTTIEIDKEFYKAEDYHQDYLQKNPNGYTCHFLRD